MPTYEYRCSVCGEKSEAFQKMSDAALTKCPLCGAESLQRVVSGGAGVLYKGEGWYVTDYSKKSSGGKESSNKEGNSNEGSKDGGNKETGVPKTKSLNAGSEAPTKSGEAASATPAVTPTAKPDSAKSETK